MTTDRRKLMKIIGHLKEAEAPPKWDGEIQALTEYRRVSLEVDLRKACEMIGLDPYEVTERAAMKEDSGTPMYLAAHEAICETAEEHDLLHGHIAAALNQNCWLDILALAYDQWKEGVE